MKKSAIFSAIVLMICMITVHAYVEQACAGPGITVVNDTQYTASIKVIQDVMYGETTLTPGGTWNYGSSYRKFTRLEGTMSNPPWGSLTIVSRCVKGSGEGMNAQCPEVDKGSTSWKIQLDATSNTYHFIKQ